MYNRNPALGRITRSKGIQTDPSKLAQTSGYSALLKSSPYVGRTCDARHLQQVEPTSNLLKVDQVLQINRTVPMYVLHFSGPPPSPPHTHIAPCLCRRPRSLSDLDTENPVSHHRHRRWFSKVCAGPYRRHLQCTEHHPEGVACPVARPVSCEEGSCGEEPADMNLGASGLATTSVSSHLPARGNKSSGVPVSVSTSEWGHPRWLDARGRHHRHGVQLAPTPKAADNVGVGHAHVLLNEVAGQDMVQF